MALPGLEMVGIPALENQLLSPTYTGKMMGNWKIKQSGLICATAV